MKVSQNNQRLQKTKYLGSSAEDRVELEDKQRAHRKFSATSNGGTRLLGIPTVLDRVIQQAIAQELSNIYDNKFSENSFGFRPGRDAKGQ